MLFLIYLMLTLDALAFTGGSMKSKILNMLKAKENEFLSSAEIAET